MGRQRLLNCVLGGHLGNVNGSWNANGFEAAVTQDMARPAAVVAPYWLAASLFSRWCGLGAGLDRGRGRETAIRCTLTKRQLHYFERRQLDFSKTPDWQLGGALLATVVASGLLNADGQSLHLEAPGEDVSQLNDLSADIGSQSVKQVSGPLRLADRQG